MTSYLDKEKKKALEAGVDEIDSLQGGVSTANLKVMERETWGGKMEFLLSCIGYAVGLGTIWRFPYLCYRNGGGAFLIPYIIFLILFGMPLVVLEMGYGQFSSRSPISIWTISPLFKGVGYGMVIISGVVCVYYNVIIAWTLYYFGMSFQSPLPWSHCKNSWNTKLCSDLWKTRPNATFANATANATGVTATVSSAMYTVAEVVDNFTDITNFTSKLKSPSEEFWETVEVAVNQRLVNHLVAPWEVSYCVCVKWFIL